jgi:ankyrin repeat protein
MRALTISFLLVLATQAGAECGNLCDDEWWKTATISDVKDELDAGVDVMSQNADGFTPLHSASMHGTNEIIQALLDAGADVMAEEADDWTPLHRAASCFECAPENIHLLLAAGASVMAKDQYGKTPWDLAQQNEKLKGTKAYWALNNAQYN